MDNKMIRFLVHGDSISIATQGRFKVEEINEERYITVDMSDEEKAVLSEQIRQHLGRGRGNGQRT